MERLEGIASMIHFMNVDIKEELKEHGENASSNGDHIDDVNAECYQPSKNIKTFICRYCNRPFGQNYHLIRHERIHTGERPFLCNYCQKRFQRNEHLARHIRIHTDERPYGCNFCHKDFRRLDHLNKHIKTHTIEKQKFINS